MYIGVRLCVCIAVFGHERTIERYFCIRPDPWIRIVSISLFHRNNSISSSYIFDSCWVIRIWSKFFPPYFIISSSNRGEKLGHGTRPKRETREYRSYPNFLFSDRDRYAPRSIQLFERLANFFSSPSMWYLGTRADKRKRKGKRGVDPGSDRTLFARASRSPFVASACSFCCHVTSTKAKQRAGRSMNDTRENSSRERK